MRTYIPADSIFDGPITNLFLTLYILTEIVSPFQREKKKTLNYFKFGTFTGRFSSDGAGSMAVKGLKERSLPPSWEWSLPYALLMG